MGFKVIQGLEDLATEVSLALINLVAKRPDSSNQRQTTVDGQNPALPRIRNIP